MRISTSKSLLFAAVFAIALFNLSKLVTASDPGNGDWPMWGGTPDRNMVSNLKGMPASWDVKTKKNVKWVAELGSQALDILPSHPTKLELECGPGGSCSLRREPRRFVYGTVLSASGRSRARPSP